MNDAPITPPEIIQSDPAAVKVWNELMPFRYDLGLDPDLNMAVIVNLCSSVSTLRRLVMELDTAPLIYRTDNGEVLLSPLVLFISDSALGVIDHAKFLTIRA